MLNQTFKFFTDTATLAIFDPLRLRHRVADDVDWWCVDFGQLEEIKAGVVALISLGGDGVYQARVTDQGLTADEYDYATERVADLGVDVVSGTLFIGSGECLPGGESDFRDTEQNRGILLTIPVGSYNVEIYAIHWFESSRWWTEDNQPPPEDAPSDLVVMLRARKTPLQEINSDPRFNGWADQFLFESSTRQIGPQSGMILTTKVRKCPDGLTLKYCGPGDYTPTLVDYSQVQWKDTIRFKVVSVNYETKEMTGEFLEVINN